MFRFLVTFTKYSLNLVHISRRLVAITPFISIKLGSLLFLLLHRMELITDQAFLIFPLALLIGWQAYRGDQGHRKNSPT